MTAMSTSPTAAEATRDGEPRATGSTGLKYLALAILMIVLACCLLIYLLSEGERGNTIAGPLSLFVAIVALICTVVIWFFEKRYIVVGASRWLSAFLEVLLVVFLLGALITAGYFLLEVRKSPDIPITDGVDNNGIR